MSTFFVSICLLIVGFNKNESKIDCSLEATYRVEYSGKNSKVLLTIDKANYPVEIKLFNLEDASYDFEKTRIIRKNDGDEFVAFDKLSDSTYLIQLISGDCKITLGGIEGIEVENSL